MVVKERHTLCCENTSHCTLRVNTGTISMSLINCKFVFLTNYSDETENVFDIERYQIKRT